MMMPRTDDGMDAWLKNLRPYLADSLDAQDFYEQGLHELLHERREWNKVISLQAKQRDEHLTELIATKRRLNELRGSWPMTIIYAVLTLSAIAGGVWQRLEGDPVTAGAALLIACMSVLLGTGVWPRGRGRSGDDHDQP